MNALYFIDHYMFKITKMHKKVIKVLGFSLYGPLAASSRYRLKQYAPILSNHGIDLHINYLLGDEYIRRRFDGKFFPLSVLMKDGFERLSILNSHQFDIAIVHCELFPLIPGWLEKIMIKKKYIYDFDDAFYLKYKIGKLGMMRFFLDKKFDDVISGAAAVTAGNSILAEYARKRNKNTYLLPTVVDTNRYIPIHRSCNDIFTIGWIGSPTTAPYLSEIVAPLSIIGKDHPIRLVVIGGKAPSIPNVVVEHIAWSEQTEVSLINTFDVGIMPLPDNEWTRGKCAFKLIQYMACGVPVVASRVGANIDLVNSECGILASNEEEWIIAFRKMIEQRSMRLIMANACRNRIERNYSLHANSSIMVELIKNQVK